MFARLPPHTTRFIWFTIFLKQNWSVALSMSFITFIPAYEWSPSLTDTNLATPTYSTQLRTRLLLLLYLSLWWRKTFSTLSFNLTTDQLVSFFGKSRFRKKRVRYHLHCVLSHVLLLSIIFPVYVPVYPAIFEKQISIFYKFIGLSK